MSLKFPFKFKHSSHSYVFTASGSGDSDKVIDITWNDSSGVEHWVTYDLLEVLNLIDTGEWFVIAEETTSPIVEISQNEYDNLVEEINLLQELLAEANNRIVDLENKSEFKPIKDMTIRDWGLATLENHKFKTRDGNEIHIVTVDNGDSIWSVGTTYGWHRVDGTFDSDREEVAEDIIERIS